MGAVAQTQQVNQTERTQLQELRAEALKLADWIADNRATGHSNLAINEKKLADLLTKNESLLKKDPNFNKTLLRDIERAKSPESRILAEATKLAQWVSHDRAQNKTDQAAYNEKQLGALLERHAEFFAANPLAAKRIATAVEKARNSVSKEKTVSATTGSAALSEEVEKQAHALSEELGYAQAKGDKQSATKLQEQLKQLQQQHNTSITSYGSSLFESELATSRQAGMQRWLTAEKDAATIQNALHLVGSDKQTIYAVLQQKQGESTEAYKTRLDALKEAHQSSYGRSLEGDLRYYLQGASEERAAALLRGDKVGARLFQLIEARGALSDDLKSIQEAYQGLSAAEIGELNNRIEAYWRKEYGVSYNKKLASSTGLSTHEYRSIEAARRGDELGVVTHNLRDAQDAIFGRETKVNKILDENRHQMAELRKDYAKKNYNTTETDNHLEKDLKKNLDAGDQQNRAVANARGEFVAADAYRLRDAVKSGDQTEVDAVLQGKTKSERAALEATYNKLPGGNTLRHDIQALGAEEAANTTTLLDSAADRPELSREALFRRAVTGWNVDEAGMVAALQGMSKAEALAFRQSYQQAHGVDPWALVERHLSGDELYAARESLLGAPETQAEAISRAEARAKYERSGLLSGVVDAFSNGQGAHLDRKLADLRSEKNTELIALRWEQLQAAADGYRDAKNSVADTAANTAAMVAAGIATALTGGAAAPVIFFAIGGSAFGATALTKYLLKGSGYGSEEQLIDLGKSATEAIAFGAGSKFARWGLSQFSRGIERRVLEEALEEIGEGGLSGALNGAVDVDWRNPRGALQGVLYGSVLGAVTGGLGGAAGARVSQRMLQGVEREIKTVTARAIESYVRKVATEGLSEAAQREALEAATRQIVRETAAIQNRLRTKLGLTMVSAASGGLTSGALNGLTALPNGMSIEETIAFLLFNAARGGGEATLGGVVGATAQRRGHQSAFSGSETKKLEHRTEGRPSLPSNTTQDPAARNQSAPALSILRLPPAPKVVPTQTSNVVPFPADRVSNDGRVEYLSEENFRKRYVEQLTREGKTREQAESQANRIGAYFDNETKSIVLRNHNGKLSLEEAINIGALIAHERAHQLHGASESEAFRAMEKYLNRNGYALRYDPQTLQLTFIRAKNPAPLTASEIATLLQQHYPAGESEARYAASIALAPAKTDNLGVTTQPAERALLDQIEASLLKHAEPFSLKDLGQIIRSVEDNLAEVNLFPDQEQIKQLLLSLTSYSSPSGFRDFKERLNLQLNNKPWMLVRPESGTIGDVLSYLSGERVGIVEEGPLNAIPMKLLMEILATTKRPRDLAEEGGYLSNLPTDPLLAIVKQDSLPTPLMVVDKATITLLKSNPTLVSLLAKRNAILVIAPGVEDALGFGSFATPEDVAHRISEIAKKLPADFFEQAFNHDEVQRVLARDLESEVNVLKQDIKNKNAKLIRTLWNKVEETINNTRRSATRDSFESPGAFQYQNLSELCDKIKKLQDLSQWSPRKGFELLNSDQFSHAKGLLERKDGFSSLLSNYRRLERWGLDVQILNLRELSPTESQDTALVSRLNGKPSEEHLPTNGSNPQRSDLTSAVIDLDDKLPPYLRRTILEIIKNSATTLSMPEMIKALRNLHQQIYQKAEERGISAENVVFVVPQRGKSYSLLTWLYRQGNPTSTAVTESNFMGFDDWRRYLAGEEPSPKGDNRVLFVSLDDFSGSGLSAIKIETAFRTRQPKKDGNDLLHVVVGATSKGRAGYESGRESKEGNVVFSNENVIHALHVPTFPEAPIYEQLDEKDQLLVTLALGGVPFNTGSMFSFSYGAPNNNVPLFQEMIAKAFAQESSVKGRATNSFRPYKDSSPPPSLIVSYLLRKKDRSCTRGALEVLEEGLNQLHDQKIKIAGYQKTDEALTSLVTDYKDFSQANIITEDIKAEFDGIKSKISEMLTAVLGSEMPFNFSDLDTLVDMVTEAHQSEMREYKIRQESIASTTKAMLELLRNWTTKSLPTAEKHGAGHLLNEELGTIQRLIERADTFLPAEH